MSAESPRATRTGLVVTSISAPNHALKTIASGCVKKHYPFWVIGDSASPPDFHLEGCRFLSIENQFDTAFEFAQKCPLRHYARKNIGYLCAIADGVQILIETDDDNLPDPAFWSPRTLRHRCINLSGTGWLNIYSYFSDLQIWPRGFPLDSVRMPPPPIRSLPPAEVTCPIQQALTDGNPDVDAIYRLVSPLPIHFRPAQPVAISHGSWCPVNSQNTTWFSPVFPLLYLPAYCPFRATDIWRGLIAQRICWENPWSVLFHPATMTQDRNEHDLMRDFADEVPVYLHTRTVTRTLESLPLKSGEPAIPDNLRLCYEALVRLDIFDKKEIPLLEAWLSDLRKLRTGTSRPAGVLFR